MLFRKSLNFTCNYSIAIRALGFQEIPCFNQMKTQFLSQFSMKVPGRQMNVRRWGANSKVICWLPSAMCLQWGSYMLAVQVQISERFTGRIMRVCVQFRRSKLEFEVPSKSPPIEFKPIFILNNIGRCSFLCTISLWELITFLWKYEGVILLWNRKWYRQ